MCQDEAERLTAKLGADHPLTAYASNIVPFAQAHMDIIEKWCALQASYFSNSTGERSHAYCQHVSDSGWHAHAAHVSYKLIRFQKQCSKSTRWLRLSDGSAGGASRIEMRYWVVRAPMQRFKG